jgi:hypothetical protein
MNPPFRKSNTSQSKSIHGSSLFGPEDEKHQDNYQFASERSKRMRASVTQDPKEVSKESEVKKVQVSNDLTGQISEEDIDLRSNLKLSLYILVILSSMILFAVADNPIGYYILLRWVSSFGFLYVLWQMFVADRINHVWIVGLLVALYNPLAPLSLGREIWTWVNFLTVGYLAVLFIQIVRIVKSMPGPK